MLKIKKNEPLSKHTTFQIGGPARYFCAPSTIEDLKSALEFANKRKIKIFILGAGSNVLASDKGFNGLVIKFKGAAGILLSKFLNYCAQRGLSGLEFLSGIPGTLGGAIYMNAGAYGKAIGEFVRCIYTVDYRGKQVEFSKRQCGFGYRKSIFQKKKLIITGVEFDLKKGKPADIKKTIRAIIRKRIKKQPYELPSAGSFFKNPKGYHSAALIEAAGCKGLRVGDAMVSRKHANFIVNLGKASSSDISKLADKVKSVVKKRFGIILVPEVRFLE